LLAADGWWAALDPVGYTAAMPFGMPLAMLALVTDTNAFRAGRPARGRLLA